MPQNLIDKVKEVEAKRLARKHPALVAKVLKIAPPTAKKRARDIASKRKEVAYLSHALKVEESPEVQVELQKRVHHSASELAGLVEKSAKKRALHQSSIQGLRVVSPKEAQLRASTIRHKIPEIEKKIHAQQAAFHAAPSAEVRDSVGTNLTVLRGTAASLKYRLSLLNKGLSVSTHHVIPQHKLKLPLRPLPLPRAFLPPKRERVAAVVRLIGASRPRKEGEKENTYRGVLRAYTKRALVRYVNKPHLPFGKAIAESVQETLMEDQPAIEEAAKLEGVPEDFVSNSMDAPLQSAGAEVEEAVIDFSPDTSTATQKDLIDQAVQGEAGALLNQAQNEEMALDAEGEEVGDRIEAAATEEPFYMKKEFLIAVGAGALFLFLSRR